MVAVRMLMLGLLVACGGGAEPGTDGSTSDEPEGSDEGTDTDDELTETGDSATEELSTGTEACEGAPEVIDLTPDELFAMMADKDFQLINVHVPYDGEIPDTDVHIRYTDTDALEEQLGHDLAAKAVLYCKTGPMSRTATRNLVERGYCRIYDLPSGMNGWVADGYTLD